MHAHPVRLCTAMQKPPEVLLRRAGRALAPAANEGSGNIMTEIIILLNVLAVYIGI